MRDFEDCLQFSFKQKPSRNPQMVDSNLRKRRKKVCIGWRLSLDRGCSFGLLFTLCRRVK
jgi:hypothetical protein